jgi:hypothetical protein
MTTNIYVLKLQKGKYYVGKTDNLEKRKQQHINGTACTWTKKYKPISVEKIIPNASDFDEDKYTKEYMSIYGIDNVRGGSYVTEELDDIQHYSLTKEIWAAKNLCTACGRNNHFVKNCYATTDVDGNSLYSSDEESDKESDEDDSCYRCGREGHYSTECYARRDVNGNYI